MNLSDASHFIQFNSDVNSPLDPPILLSMLITNAECNSTASEALEIHRFPWLGKVTRTQFIKLEIENNFKIRNYELEDISSHGSLIKITVDSVNRPPRKVKLSDPLCRHPKQGGKPNILSLMIIFLIFLIHVGIRLSEILHS
jgi:hypothetical protein